LLSYVAASLAALAAAVVSISPLLTPPPWAVGPVAVVVLSTIAVVAYVRTRRERAEPMPSGLALFS
jgi:membrane protein implicated in regulation of membrane protease activity